MSRATRTARKLEETIFDLLQTGFNPEGAGLNKILDYVKCAGAIGRSQSDIARAFQYIKAPERTARLSTVVETGDVVRFTRPTSGRPAFVYVFRDYAKRHQEEFPGDKPM